jgi:valyl-tRNA synthetase
MAEEKKKAKAKYDPSEAEPKWQKFWEEKGIYKFNPKAEGEIYSIDTPPPTVSGKMHLGHSFSYSQQDFIARYKKMVGFNVYYPFGTDDNGLPTKLLIEKEKKVRAADMSRKDFVQLCLKTLKEELRPKYVADWKRIGMSCDFSMFYTTINEHCQRLSQKSFLDLYKMGREYRTEAPAMYCPKCQTAISQVECEDKEIPSFFNDVVFNVGGEDLIIATTRPELLPACVAVFYHPDDKRYKKYKGKTAKVPLFDFEVPILEDKKADPEKGTGIVMCCTFGDSTDAEWQKAHHLPIKEAISKEGKMTKLAGKYEGMSIETARKMIIEDMKDKRLIVSQQPIKHAVNVHERCGTPIEFVHSKQWFIKYLDLKKDMLRWGKELKWFPDHMRNRYENWVQGLQWDWCISRQLPFGVPFPVWYCKKCDEVVVAEEKDLPVDPLYDKPPAKKCPKCGGSEFVPEKDIINTWATSSLTPQIAAALVPEMYDKLYPMSLRPQAHDIISFWLFNTVVKSRLHNKTNPWKDVVISGWALDPHGKKMSKSKGNVVEPQAMIEKYSADCLRFWAAGSKLGDDLPFQEKDFVTAQKIITKLWNASRFASMHLEDYDIEGEVELEEYDRAVLSRMNRMIDSCTKYFDNYEYSKTKNDVEAFFWQNICDFYLEIAKDRLYNPDKRGEMQRKSAQYTLYRLILTTIKMLAPIMPHITEEIYQLYFKKNEKAESVHISKWPSADKKLIDENAEAVGAVIDSAVEHVRRAKSEQNISLKEPVKRVVIEAKISEDDFEKIKEDIKGVTHAESVEFKAIKPESKKDMECIIDI